MAEEQLAAEDQLDDGGSCERKRRYLQARAEGRKYVMTEGDLQMLAGKCEMRLRDLLQDLDKNEVVWDLEEQAFGIGRDLDRVELGLRVPLPDLRRDLALVLSREKKTADFDKSLCPLSSYTPDEEERRRPPRDFYLPRVVGGGPRLLPRRGDSLPLEDLVAVASRPPSPLPSPPEKKKMMSLCESFLDKKKRCLAALILFLVSVVTVLDFAKTYLNAVDSSVVVEALKATETLYNLTVNVSQYVQTAAKG